MPCSNKHGVNCGDDLPVIEQTDDEVPFVKYLGHVITDMKDDLDIMRQCRQLYAQGNALARRFHM